MSSSRERSHYICGLQYLHAVCEYAVHTVGHLGVFFLQVPELFALSLSLLLQDVDLLPVDPDGERRRSVQHVLQLRVTKENF